MSILIITTATFFFSALSIFIFKRWFNHLLLYTIVWGFLLVMYELKLMRFVDLSPLAWFSICGAYLSFFFGTLIPIVARNSTEKQKNEVLTTEKQLKIFMDGGTTVKHLIIIFSIIGLLGALHHWWILLKMFGSVTSILLNANQIYRMRVENDIPGLIPYIYLFSYAAVFLSGIYVSNKKKMSIVALLPFISVLIKEIANVGRAGMLMSFLLFLASFMLYKLCTNQEKIRTTFRNKLKIVAAVTIIFALITSAAGLIRSTRGTIESFQASSRQLNQLRGGFLITPSIYLYMSSHVGVFSKFLERDFDKKNYFGEKTFQPVYNFLAKFDIVKHPGFYAKGYNIPMWSNTSTYLRELHEDFGVSGIFLVPFLLGLFCSILWQRVIAKNSILLLLTLSYLYVLLIYSSIVMISHHAIWSLTLLMLIFTLPLTEKIVIWKLRRRLTTPKNYEINSPGEKI